MGCDIHLMVEYDISNRGSHWKYLEILERQEPYEPFSDAQYIRSFSEGELLILRDYDLFEALAGVRADEGFSPLIPPRGFPERATSDVINQFFHYVLDEGEEPLGIDEVTREEAEGYIERGVSFYRDHRLKPRGLVSNPQWHTPSWLTASEALTALAHAKLDLAETSCEFQLTLELMRGLERCFGEDRARIVFWFDN